MSDGWNGVPVNPERDGWHWLQPAMGPAYAFTVRWHNGEWFFPHADEEDLANYADHMKHGHWTYLGPALLPSDIEARVAAARLAEREAAAKVCDAHEWVRRGTMHMPATQYECAAAILAQPAPSGADALAARLAEARRAGIEEAAARLDAVGWRESANEVRALTEPQA